MKDFGELEFSKIRDVSTEMLDVKLTGVCGEVVSFKVSKTQLKDLVKHLQSVVDNDNLKESER